ncbi:MAG: O-antigen ligase family protein [Clostridia bacterium]|nr:O-antigen ligase family protein [Clostridia bacterium]
MSTGNESKGQLSFFGKAQSSEQKDSSTVDGFVNEEHYDSSNANDDAEKYSAKTDFSSPNPIYDDDEPQTDAEIAPEHNVRPQKVNSVGETPVAVIKQKPKSTLFNYQNSVILTFLLFVGGALAKLFRNSFTATLFTSFQNTSQKFKNSFLYSFFFNQNSTKFTGRVKKQFRKTATVAFIPSMLGAFSSALMKVKTRIYGVTLFSFAVTSLLLYFFVTPNFSIFNIDIYAPITCLIVALASLFLMLFNGSLSRGIKESFILSTLLFGFLGIKRPSFSDNEIIDVSASGCSIAGVALGALTLFFPAHIIITVIFTAIYTYLVVKYPETGLISLILFIPFMYTNVLLYIVCVITVSYVFKLLTGKRTPNFEFADLFFALFLILSFLSDIFTFGESLNVMTSTAFILIYFLCVCMLRDKVWFDRAINSVVLGACVYAAYSIFVTFIGNIFDLGYITYVANTDYGPADSSALNSSSILGITVVIGIFYLLSYLFTTKSKSNRFGLLLLIVASIIYVFREASISVLIGLILALILYMVLKTNKTFIFIIFACAVIPLLPLFNSGVYSGIMLLIKDEMYRLDIWSAVVNMLTRYFLTGIGNSPDAFPTLYSSYYVGNTVSVPHAHSMIFQLSISLGFIGLLLFALIIFFILQGAFSFGRNSADKSSKNRLVCYAGMCAVIALTISGFFENIMYNPRTMLMFWLVCGLTVCARRSTGDRPATAEFLSEIDENYNG